MLCTWVWLCQTITKAGDQLDLLVKGHKSVKTITYKTAQTLVIYSQELGQSSPALSVTMSMSKVLSAR